MRQWSPGGRQHHPHQVSLAGNAQLGVDLPDMPTDRRLRPACRHGDVPHTVAPGQGDRHPAFGASEAEERRHLDGINMGWLLGIDEQRQRGHALDAKVCPKADRVDMQGERWPAGS